MHAFTELNEDNICEACNNAHVMFFQEIEQYYCWNMIAGITLYGKEYTHV